MQCSKQHTTGQWKGITGWTDAQERECTGATRRRTENPNVRETYSLVDLTHHITSVGLTGDRKNRVQKRFSARDLWKLRWLEDQIKSKGAQILQAWSQGTCEHVHGRNRRITPLFGRNRGIPSKNGGFLLNAKNFDSSKLVIPGGLALV